MPFYRGTVIVFGEFFFLGGGVIFQFQSERCFDILSTDALNYLDLKKLISWINLSLDVILVFFHNTE